MSCRSCAKEEIVIKTCKVCYKSFDECSCESGCGRCRRSPCVCRSSSSKFVEKEFIYKKETSKACCETEREREPECRPRRSNWGRDNCGNFFVDNCRDNCCGEGGYRNVCGRRGACFGGLGCCGGEYGRGGGWNGNARGGFYRSGGGYGGGCCEGGCETDCDPCCRRKEKKCKVVVKKTIRCSTCFKDSRTCGCRGGRGGYERGGFEDGYFSE